MPANGPSSPITVTGLTNGLPYKFKVRARNSAGWGPYSALSATVTPAASGGGTPLRQLYVSPTGNDANDGLTSGTAKRQLNAINAIVQPGDQVNIAAGSYDACTLTTSGTSSARIRYVSTMKWGASFSSPTGGPIVIFNIPAAYIDLVGLDITSPNGRGRYGTQIGLNGRVIGCRAHDFNIPTTGTTLDGAGLSTTNNEGGQQFIGCLVYNIGTGAMNQFNADWASDPTTNRVLHGIYVDRDAFLYNNIIYGCVGDAVTSYHSATRMTVVNNTIHNCGGIGVVLARSAEGTGPPYTHVDSYVTNNIVYGCRNGAAESNGVGTQTGDQTFPGTNYFYNNLFFGNFLDIVNPWHNATEAGTIVANPLFADLAGHDYHLQASSPAINAGVAVGSPTLSGRSTAPTTDYAGASRTGNPDAGAYEATFAASKYAATTGNDTTGNGTVGSPYRTLKKLVTSLSPGQTGYLRGGRYADIDIGDYTLYLATGLGSRTAANPITISAYPTEIVDIVGPARLEPSGIVFRNLRINVKPLSGTADFCWFVIGNDIAFESCDFTSNTEGALTNAASNSSALFFGDGGNDPGVNRPQRTIVRRCNFHDIRWNGVGNQPHGIYAAHADNSVIEDCKFYDITVSGQFGVQIYPNTTNMTIRWCLFANSAAGVIIGAESPGQASIGHLIDRNIFATLTGASVTTYWGTAGTPANTANTVSNNHFFTVGSTPATGSGITVSGNTTGDPLFTSQATRQYYPLGAGSPAAGKGTDW